MRGFPQEAILGFCTRAYLLLGLLPQNLTRVYVELVGPVLFVDMTQTLLAVVFILLAMSMSVYGLVTFPWWVGLPLVLVQVCALVAMVLGLFELDKDFFCTMILTRAGVDQSRKQSLEIEARLSEVQVLSKNSSTTSAKTGAKRHPYPVPASDRLSGEPAV